MKDSFFTLTFFPRKPRAAGDGEYLENPERTDPVRQS